MEFLADYGLFFIKTITLVAAILLTVAGVIALSHRHKDKPELEITKINDKFQDMADAMNNVILNKKELREQHKQQKKHDKEHKDDLRRRVFVLQFKGDIKASAVDQLRDEITAVLKVATPKDEVTLVLESAGGMVHTYGLAASQLQRIRDKKIPLTICIDKVAASGGYLMACVGDRINAAPFAIVGSIGVLAQIPNFHKLLKHNHIDYELITAGEYKRTLTIFGENTDKARRKFSEDLEDIHVLFKDFIMEHRPIVDIQTVATGEHWLGKRALDLRLVDHLVTSDDYLLDNSQHADIYEIKMKRKEKIASKLANSMQALVTKFYHGVAQEERESRFQS